MKRENVPIILLVRPISPSTSGNLLYELEVYSSKLGK